MQNAPDTPQNDAISETDKTSSKGIWTRLQSLSLKPEALSLLLKHRGSALWHAGSRRLAGTKMPTGSELSAHAAKAARTVRHRTKPSMLNKDYRRFLHLAQEVGYDRSIEKLFFLPTRGYISLDTLTIDSPNRHFGHDYHPIHRLSFDWAVAQLPEKLNQFTFVDYGAGQGRALLLASMHAFRRIIGIEFAQELQDDAKMNIAQFPRSLMKCRDIDCLLMDAVDFPIPEEKTVFLMNDVFDHEVLETILARITASYRANPRRLYLIFVRPLKAAVLDQLMERTVIFEPVYHSQSEKMRLQILSPDQVQIFKTLI